MAQFTEADVQIALVDDEADIRDIIQGILIDEGVAPERITQFRNGGEAMDALRQNGLEGIASGRRPAIVLQDGKCGGGVTGVEVTQAIRDEQDKEEQATGSRRNVYVIAVTAESNMTYGDEKIQKPFNLTDLLDAVDRGKQAVLA